MEKIYQEGVSKIIISDHGSLKIIISDDGSL